MIVAIVVLIESFHDFGIHGYCDLLSTGNSLGKCISGELIHLVVVELSETEQS